MRKHIIGIMITLLLAIGAFGMTVSAAEEDFNYKEVNGGIEITGYRGSDRNVVIPDTIEGKPVVSIGYSAFYVRDIISVEIPATVGEIGGQAFSYCDELTKVTFRGNGLKEIKERAFASCGKLSDFAFPNTLRSVEQLAFRGCNSLHRADLSKTQITKMERAVFYDCKGLTDVSFPPGMDQIPEDTFVGCESLRNVVINGNNIKVIGESAFQFCKSLSSFTIPSTVIKIESYAFNSTNSLTSITVPASVKSIGYAAFNSSSLKTVYCEYGSYAYNYFKKMYGVKVVATGTYLKKNKLTIYVGEKQTLALANKQGGTTFSSSNKKVVSVSSKGVIKGLKKGTATITAKNGNTVSKCKVTVKALNLNYKKATVTAGFQLQLKLAGATKVKWSSSDNSVATVSQKGVVKANHPGNVTITAKNKGKKYTCKVTVAANEKVFKTYGTSYQQYPSDKIYVELSKVYKEGDHFAAELTVSNNTYFKMKSIATLDIRIYANGNLILTKDMRDMAAEVPAHSRQIIRVEFTGSEVKKSKVDLRNSSITNSLSNGKTWMTY